MKRAGAIALTMSMTLTLAACGEGLVTDADMNGPWAPGLSKTGEVVDQNLVGHRLMEAGEYELALKAFTREAAETGMTPDLYAALGTANLGLGRLGQAETLMRRAVESEDASPESWNNLGVVLMERGEIAEASQIFRKAYALDNGQSDSIRDNLRLALAKLENTDYGVEQEQDYKLVRRGSNDYLIRRLQ